MYETLMETAVTDENYAQALAAVKRNRAAAGIDRMTTAQLDSHLQANWWILKDKLLKGSYVPSPVRRVEIPKPSGGTRMLGIPTVQDRFIQQLLLQALTPILDPSFSEHSYGFRPGRSAQDAVRAAQQYAQEGKDWVVDLGQTGVALDREVPAAGSNGERVGGSQCGRNAARRTFVSATGQHLSG
jgi:retron-type reverse transcriptase